MRRLSRSIALPGLLAIAAALPPLVAYALQPVASAFNQLSGLLCWGAVVVVLAMRPGQRRIPPAAWALMVLLGAALATPQRATAPWTLPLINAGFLIESLVLMLCTARLAPADRELTFRGLALGLLVAGVLSVVVCLLQVLAPGWTGNALVAYSGLVGRAIGNVRQPNLLASLLVCAAVAAVYCAERGGWAERGRGWWLSATLGALVLGVVLSASRTGLLGVALLLLWGVLDRRLSRLSRWALMTTPLMLALCFGLMSAWAHFGAHAFGAETRLSTEGATSQSRMLIWRDVWTLALQHPWLGVGWGELNWAWTLSPFPDRKSTFLDNAHNLPLHLAAELGFPLALLVLGLLGWSLWQIVKGIRDEGGAEGPESSLMLRSGLLLLLVVAIHSLLEYPLWFVYFLMPCAAVLGLCVPPNAKAGEMRANSPVLALAGLILVWATTSAAREYLAISKMYLPSATRQMTVFEGIATVQRSFFFRDHGDYAAAITLAPGPYSLQSAQRAGHRLIGGQLLKAWAEALHATGHEDQARYLAARLKEFRLPEYQTWFAACNAVPAGRSVPFQCATPQGRYDYTSFR